MRKSVHYVVPLSIAVSSMVATLFWDNEYPVAAGVPLELHVGPSQSILSRPSQAQQVLRAGPAVSAFYTHLSEDPIWFSFATMPGPRTDKVIEFPSRHTMSIACWDAGSMQLLGSATRGSRMGGIEPANAGFALKLQTLPAKVLCRGTFAGPARFAALEMSHGDFIQLSKRYHHNSGLLDGGLIALALFVLCTAIINRQPLYLQFAGWLLLNLRIGELSAGWDIQWLGQQVPADWLVPGRAVTIALYAISTVALYTTLFGAKLAHTRFARPLRLTQFLALCLLPCAIWLPYGHALVAMRLVAGIGFSTMGLGLVKVVLQSRNRVAMWFAGSFAVTILFTAAEMIATAVGNTEIVGVVNSVTAALVSSLLAALALAEQMRVETEKRMEAKGKLEQAFEVMPVGLFSLDMSGRLLSANPALLKMLGASAIVPGGTQWSEFFDESYWETLRQLVSEQKEGNMLITRRSGSERFMISATLTHNRVEAVLQDVTEKSKAARQLRFMANNDPLTKVLNRHGVEKIFESAAKWLADGSPVALAYIDMDRFKLVNELFGHAAGDEVLKQVCERVERLLGDDQILARVGGDEFVIVMSETTISLATLLCRRIIDCVGSAAYRVGDKAFHVRGSIGLIEISPGMSMKDSLSAAERACREAKAGHNAGLVVYERDSDAFRERESELRQAERLAGPNATEGMVLEMQPIMSLSAPHESLNFEVLLRTRGADGRIRPAGPLIAAAEKNGRMCVIDHWVLSTTLAWIEENRTSLTTTRFICMNLSGLSLNDERFVIEMLELLERYAHVASLLCIEIKESVALHDLNSTRRFIDQVRAFGVRVALDDFGAGRTSFAFLEELPVDALKIDGKFITNINTNPANVVVIEAIVNLAGNLGMKTIAEWVEDAPTMRTLAEIGVDYVQGRAIAGSQLPAKLLAAGSSASFIKSDEVLHLVRQLSISANEP